MVVLNGMAGPTPEPSQLPSYEEALSAPLKEPEATKAFARGIVEKYVLDTESKMDGSMHPALDATCPHIKLDSESHKWVDNEPDEENINLEKYYKDVSAEEQRFLEAMEEYERTADPKYKTRINLKETHTIEQVWAVVDSAVAKYNVEDVSGFWGSIRKAFRKLGEHNETLNGWLGLLPTESHYLSVLCGGLKMILGAAALLKKLRDDISKALCEIPIVLNSTQRVLAIHKKSGRLQNCSSALYISILYALSHILKYFRHKAVPKGMRAFFQQSSFESGLSAKIEAIQQCSEAFNKEATLCADELLKRAEQVGGNTNRVAKGVYQEVRDVKQMQEIMYREQWRTQKETLERMKAAEESNKELKQMMAATCETMNKVTALFISSPQVLDISFVQMNLAKTKATLSADTKSQSKDLSSREARRLLISRLSFDEEAIREDVLTNIVLAMILPLEGQDRAVYVIKSPVLATWSNAIHSAMLLVNGNAKKVERRSPLTFVCAKLAESLYQVRRMSTGPDKHRVLAVHFFCGEHVDWQSSPNNSACGVANSILAQLLHQCKHVDLAPTIKLGDFENYDIDAVCIRFDKVLAQLPRETMVFCIIDGLSFYLDDEEREKEANRLVKWLIRFAKPLRRKRGEERCVFKVLLTAAKRLHSAAIDDLQDDEVLNVPRTLARGGGFTDMKWELGAGQHVGGLAR